MLAFTNWVEKLIQLFNQCSNVSAHSFQCFKLYNYLQSVKMYPRIPCIERWIKYYSQLKYDYKLINRYILNNRLYITLRIHISRQYKTSNNILQLTIKYSWTISIARYSNKYIHMLPINKE